MKLLKAARAHAPKPFVKSKRNQRRCNICKNEFKPRTAFERFCATCKQGSELFRFCSCYPEADADFLERIPA